MKNKLKSLGEFLDGCWIECYDWDAYDGLKGDDFITAIFTWMFSIVLSPLFGVMQLVSNILEERQWRKEYPDSATPMAGIVAESLCVPIVFVVVYNNYAFALYYAGIITRAYRFLTGKKAPALT